MKQERSILPTWMSHHDASVKSLTNRLRWTYWSVTKASHELRRSQPAVSHDLRALKGRYGILTRKDGRGITVTERGQAFHKAAEHILARVAALDEQFGVKNEPAKVEILVLGGSHGPWAQLLPSLIAQFRESHPSLQLESRAGRSGEIEKLVLDSEIDIGIISNPTHHPSLVTEPYRSERMLPVGSATDPLAKKKEISSHDLTTIPLLVGIERKGGAMTEQTLSRLLPPGGRLNIAMRCESSVALRGIVKQGLGMGMLCEDLAQEDIENGSMKVLKLKGVNLVSQTCIIYSRHRPLSTPAQEFLTLMREFRSQNEKGADPEGATVVSRGPARKKHSSINGTVRTVKSYILIYVWWLANFWTIARCELV